MKFFVLIYNPNSKQIENFDIFNNGSFCEDTKMAVKEFKEGNISKEEYCNRIKNAARYAFWSKREYELMMADAFEDDITKYKKNDVYKQIEANIGLISNYLLKE